MKNSILIIVTLVVSLHSRGQGVLGFFNQQGTKKKNMAEQIVLLNTYLAEVKSGYSVTKNGLTTIHNLKEGSFNLNGSYFNSLVQLNSAIANNPKVKEITSLAQEIITEFAVAMNWERQQKVLNADEYGYIELVKDNIESACGGDLVMLQDLVTPGKLQLKDEERLQRIDQVDVSMKDKYNFTGVFISNIRSVTLGKQEEIQQAFILKHLYNLK